MTIEQAPNPFAPLLRRHRREAGLTQEALAEQAGIAWRTVSDLERGVTFPRRETLDLLTGALGLDGARRTAFEAAARRQPTAVDAAPAPLAGHPMPLVGRAAEIALLERHLAGEGPPLLLLAGEPGIGKSRLLGEAAQRAAATGWRILHGGCARGDGQLPYTPLLQALQRHINDQPLAQQRLALHGCAWLVRLLPELVGGPIEPLPPWNLPPEQERRLMVEAVSRFLGNVAGPTGTLLLLDDLHWAGPDALDLLATLVRRTPELPLRVIGAYRDTEVETQGPLGVFLADLAQAGLAAHRRVGPLAPAEAGTLLDGLLGDGEAAARVLARAGGVPFFLISCAEGLRHGDRDGGQDTLPWAVEQSIRQRVAALPAGAAAVLATAAVVGREAPHALLVTVMEREASQILAACDAACRARLLEEQGAEGYRFAHDVIREVLERDLGAGRRALTHRRIAAALEQGPGAPPVELLAYHYARCDEQDKAVYYLEQAGDQARARAAHAAAERHYRELVERLDRLGRAPESADVREKLAEVLATVARYDAALALLDEAAESREAAGDLEGLGRIAARMGHIHYHRGTLEEGVARLQPVLERLEARGPSVALAMAYCALAELNLFWGQWGQEVAAAERAGHIARLVGDDRALAHAELLRGEALRLMSKEDEGLAALSAAIRLAEMIGDLECLCDALGSMAWFYGDRGEFEQFGRFTERALLAAEKLGSPVRMADAFFGIAALAFERGEWERARAYYAREGAIHRQIALSPESCEAGGLLIAVGRLRMREGAWEEAYSYLEQSRIIFAPQGKRAGLREVQGLLAEHDILAGRPEEARARLLPLLDRAGMEELAVTFAVLPVLAWACLELGEVDQANHMITEAIRRTRAGSYRRALVDALRVAALVALRQEQWPAAESSIEDGLALARALPYPYGEGRLREVESSLLRKRGDPAAARECLAAALAIFTRLGAQMDGERIEQALAMCS